MQNNKIKVAIIDDDQQLCHTVMDYLAQSEQFAPAGCAHDGISGLELLQKGGIDVVLLDIVLPVRDGIFILEEWHDKKGAQNDPAIIIISSLRNNTLAEKAMDLGANYYILKPFDVELLSRRIIDMHTYRQQANTAKVADYGANVKLAPEQFAVQILHRMEIGIHLKGYNYLKEAICICINDENYLTGITKWLYPTVAKTFRTTHTSVERAMRNAIEQCWLQDSGKNLHNVFLLDSLLRKRPTVSKILNLVIENYKLNFKKG